MKTRIATVTVVLLSLSLLGGEFPGDKSAERPLWTTRDGPPSPKASAAGLNSFSRLVERARPAVVAIHTIMGFGAVQSGESLSPFPFNPWRFFPDAPRRERQEGIGSGFFIRDDGYLVRITRIKKGTWLLAVRIVGDDLWGKVKRGDLTGFSIGGSAARAQV